MDVFIGLSVDNGMVWDGVKPLFIGTPSPPPSWGKGIALADKDALDDGEASDVCRISQVERFHQFVPVLFDCLYANSKLIGQMLVLVSQGNKPCDLEHSFGHRCGALFHFFK